MPASNLIVQEEGKLPSGFCGVMVLQQAVTGWLITQINTPTQMMPAPNFRRRHLK